MKVDVKQLMGPELEPESPPDGPKIKLFKGIGVLAACLIILGGFTVYDRMNAGDSASADTPYEESESNPSFTVQHMGMVETPVIEEDTTETKGKIPVLVSTEGTWNVSTENGLLKTEKSLTELYAGYETTWNKGNTISALSFLNGEDGEAASGYELAEIWFGKDKDSTEQSDFILLSVPKTEEGAADISKIRFTNNPDNMGLSAVLDGWYQPLEDGSYVIPIEDGDVVRLMFQLSEGNESSEAVVYDYDITDGGYYLNSDYLHKGSRYKSSSQYSRKGNLFLDLIQKGINQEANYSGEGTKLGFGGTLGTGLSDESRENELDTVNVYNVMNTETTGVSLNLTKGIDSDGNLLWGDGISVPALFAGKASGKTAYSDKYTTEFTKSGFTRILSSVSSTYGTKAAGLEKLGTGFWIADGLPTAGADNHDILWGNGSKNVKYYRDGDRGAKSVKAASDKKNHNLFFGMGFSQDFTLSPGYTGPLDVFGYSDDDLWIYAVRVDSEGNLMEDTAACVTDLGGVHDGAACYTDLWDVIEPVAYGEEEQHWRLFVYWLERDGVDAECGLRFTLPDAAIINEGQETGSVSIEAADYRTDNKKSVRTFVFDDGTNNKYSASLSDGTPLTITAGKEFDLTTGNTLTVSGVTAGEGFTVKETGKPYAWSSSGDGYAESDTVEGVAGETGDIKFLSVENPAKISIGTDADATPDGGFVFSIDLENVPSTGILAVSTGEQKQLAMDGNGHCSVAIGAGDVLSLYNLPEGTGFSVTAGDVDGYRVTEIKPEGDLILSGKTVSGTADASVLYRYETGEETKVPKITMEQSVTGDWGRTQVDVKQGIPISYNIKLENPYDVDMEFIVEDVVPEGLTVTEPVMSNGVVTDGVVTWEVKMEAGSSATLSFTGTVGDTAEGTFENKASVLIDGTNAAESNTVKAAVKE